MASPILKIELMNNSEVKRPEGVHPGTLSVLTSRVQSYIEGFITTFSLKPKIWPQLLGGKTTASCNLSFILSDSSVTVASNPSKAECFFSVVCSLCCYASCVATFKKKKKSEYARLVISSPFSLLWNRSE